MAANPLERKERVILKPVIHTVITKKRFYFVVEFPLLAQLVMQHKHT